MATRLDSPALNQSPRENAGLAYGKYPINIGCAASSLASPRLCSPTPLSPLMAPCFSFTLCPPFSPWGTSCLSPLCPPSLPGRPLCQGMAHWHLHLILSRLSCGCKSALIIRHLVPAINRAEGARPGGSWLETGREGNQAPRCRSQGCAIISKAVAALTGHLVPGVCARLSRATNHRGARGLEWGEWPGAWLQVPRADSRWMVWRQGREGCRAASPKHSVPYLRAL